MDLNTLNTLNTLLYLKVQIFFIQYLWGYKAAHLKPSFFSTISNRSYRILPTDHSTANLNSNCFVRIQRYIFFITITLMMTHYTNLVSCRPRKEVGIIITRVVMKKKTGGEITKIIVYKVCNELTAIWN